MNAMKKLMFSLSRTVMNEIGHSKAFKPPDSLMSQFPEQPGGTLREAVKACD